MKETIKTLLEILTLYAISIFSVVLYFVATLLLYPIGYFAHALSYLGMLSALGIVFIYKKQGITKKLFIVTASGAIITVLVYILTTMQDWTVFAFVFTLLAVSCALLFLLAIRFLK